MDDGFEDGRYVYMFGTAQPHYPPTWRKDYAQTMLMPEQHCALGDDVAEGRKKIPMFLDHPLIKPFEQAPEKDSIGSVAELWGHPTRGVMVLAKLDLRHPTVQKIMEDVRVNK